jgi:hypothetical protein
MFGLVISVVFSVSAVPALAVPALVALPAAFPSGSAAGSICDPTPSAACDPAPAVDLEAPDADGPQYATEAVIDCPTPALAVIGECDGTVRDASYRASRDPESERLPGSLRPARRDRTTAGVLAACAGVPVDARDGVSSPNPTQPLALFAVPGLHAFASSRFSVDSPPALPWRGIRPLERPPRA